MDRLNNHTDVFTDLTTLNKIKAAGRQDQGAGIKEVAKKFESIFVNMMLKSMRKANESFEEGNFLHSSESQFYRDMFDQQISVSLTQGRGIGLADILAQQLAAQHGITLPDDKPLSTKLDGNKHTNDQVNGIETGKKAGQALPTLASIHVQPLQDAAHTITAASPETIPKTIPKTIPDDEIVDLPNLDRSQLNSDNNPAEVISNPRNFDDPQAFVQGLYPHATQAASVIGLEPKVLLAQAALETGWGKGMSRRPDGSPSFNVFNIKADRRWQGETVFKETTEYRQGVALNEVAKFRAYGSYAESFADYVQFLQSNPRYTEALAQTSDSASYLQALQQAGYATDPHYAKKILRIVHGPLLKVGIEIANGSTISDERTIVAHND